MSWSAFHYNGRDAERREVMIDALPDGLRLIGADEPILWPYAAVRLAPGSVTGEAVKFDLTAPGVHEVLIVADRSILHATALHASHLRPHSDRSPLVPLAIAGAIASIVLIAVLYFWALPALADRAASHVPVAWEQKLGEAVLAELAPDDRVCRKQELSPLAEIAAALTRGDSSSYQIRVSVLRDPTVNAFAAPGGAVVVHSGLLEKTRRAEELAAVLAHEIEHVVQRHATRSLLREMSSRLIFTLIAGDADAVAAALGAAGTLGSLHFQREHEESADRMALVRIQRARIDPQGMLDMFAILEKAGMEMPKMARYLSTHPLTGDRISMLREIARRHTEKPVPLLPGIQWQSVAGACVP